MIFENARLLEMRRISAAKLMEGGAAILHETNKNHQNVIVGKSVIRPLVMNILRD